MKMLLAGALLLCAASPAAGVDLTFSAIQVNGVTIPASRVHIDLGGRQHTSQVIHGSAPAAGSDAKKLEQVVDRIIVRELLAQEARRRGLAVAAAELAAAYEAERTRWGSEEKFAKSLEFRGITAEYLRERLADDLLLRKLVEGEYAKIAVTERDERAHYEKNPALFAAPGPTTLRCLYIDHAKHGGEQGAGERFKAFQARLDKGEQFAKLIEEFSDHPTAGAGGAVGENPEPPLPFMESARALRPGQFTDPRSDDRGIYCFFRDRNPQILAFDKARPQVRQALVDQLRNERFGQLLRELRAAARIEYRP